MTYDDAARAAPIGLPVIAALYVQTHGAYFGVPGVDPWDVRRDARRYAGPHRVIAHPPCSRWCRQLAPLNERRYGLRIGDDGGCFAAALAAVNTFGGVLEHPANTIAWDAFNLPKPPRSGWLKVAADAYVCEVSQAAYGHPARKRTWLYYKGSAPFELDWSKPKPSAWVSCGAYKKYPHVRRLNKQEASATPPAFKAVLLALARLGA